MTNYEEVIKMTNPTLYDYISRHGVMTWNADIYKDVETANRELNIWKTLYEELTRLNDVPTIAKFLAGQSRLPADDYSRFSKEFPLLQDVLTGSMAKKHSIKYAVNTPIIVNAPNSDTIITSVPSYIFFYSHDPKKALLNSNSSDYAVLSNWAWTPFVVDQIKYNSVEQWMMWSKAILFNDVKSAAEILSTGSQYDSIIPTSAQISKVMGAIKKLGRLVCNFNEGTWSSKRYMIVLRGITAKFSQNANAKDILLRTENAIMCEASPRDKVWGIGLGPDKARTYLSLKKTTDMIRWPGSNLLGEALVEVRSHLQ